QGRSAGHRTAGKAGHEWNPSGTGQRVGGVAGIGRDKDDVNAESPLAGWRKLDLDIGRAVSRQVEGAAREHAKRSAANAYSDVTGGDVAQVGHKQARPGAGTRGDNAKVQARRGNDYLRGSQTRATQPVCGVT